MLTDKLVRDVRFRLQIFQPRIYPSDAVESGMGEYMTSRREQQWRSAYNIHKGVNFEQNMHVSGVGPQSCQL